MLDIDYYMAFFISYPLSALGHDIWTRADKGNDIKNDIVMICLSEEITD